MDARFKERNFKWLALLLIPLLATAIYWPSLEGAFIMDDWGYITKNPAITDTSSPLIFWTRLDQPDYWPLSYTAYWSFFRLFGEDPLGYHLVNVFLHTLNALLLTLIASELGAPWWGAFLFLVHPMNVQAVSWMIQLKTLLATGFGLLCTLFFLRGSKLWPSRFLLLGMLSKSSLITLPGVLWALARQSAQKKSALYLMLISFTVGLISLFVQEQNFAERNAAVFSMSWWNKPFFIAQNLSFYLQKFFLPLPLGLTYRLSLPSIESPSAWAQLTTALVLLTGLMRLGSALMRRLAASYILLLMPGLGFVILAGMKVSFAYDHWAYLANAFLSLWLAQALTEFFSARSAMIVFVTIASALTVLSHEHTKTFLSEESFWRQAALTNPFSAVPAYNLGVVLARDLKTKAALEQFERAVQIDPEHGRAWYNLGLLKELSQDWQGARLCFRKSEDLRGRYPGQRIPAHKLF